MIMKVDGMLGNFDWNINISILQCTPGDLHMLLRSSKNNEKK